MGSSFYKTEPDPGLFYAERNQIRILIIQGGTRSGLILTGREHFRTNLMKDVTISEAIICITKADQGQIYPGRNWIWIHVKINKS